jgi:hypothetical protein
MAQFEPGLTRATNARPWQQFWIAWRRIGAGLRDETQVRIRDAIDPFIAPAELKLKKRKTLKPEAPEELLELAASLERVPIERRVALGQFVLERTWTDRDPRLWAALGRLAARVPALHPVGLTRPPDSPYSGVIRRLPAVSCCPASGGHCFAMTPR